MRQKIAYLVFMFGYWFIYWSSLIDEEKCREMLIRVYSFLRKDGQI